MLVDALRYLTPDSNVRRVRGHGFRGRWHWEFRIPMPDGLSTIRRAEGFTPTRRGAARRFTEALENFIDEKAAASD